MSPVVSGSVFVTVPLVEPSLEASELDDIVGLDVRLGIAEQLHRELGPRFAPPALLRQMVAEGRLCKKSGRGFYDWT